MVMFPVHQVWPKPSCRAQWKGEEHKADRGRGGKTISGNGQAWTEGSGEQGKMEQTGCKIICGAPMILAVKGLMMIMMMMIILCGWLGSKYQLINKLITAVQCAHSSGGLLLHSVFIYQGFSCCTGAHSLRFFLLYSVLIPQGFSCCTVC